jgi:hypothetical protein
MNTTKRIVAATIALLTLLPIAGAQASSPPGIAPVHHKPLEYILPPTTSEFYDLIKKNAEDVQYPTREHGDLRYPA